MFSGHHGNTPAAWTGVTIAFLGFCVAGAAVVRADPVLMWVGLGVVVLGGVVGKAMQMAGLGKAVHENPAGKGAGQAGNADEGAQVGARH